MASIEAVSPTASRAAARGGCRLGRCPSEDLRAELDFGADLAREDLAIRVLEDDPDPGRERGDPLVHDVRAVVQDAALGRSQQAVEVADHRRLAAAVLADDGHELALGDRQVDAVEGTRAVRIDEADLLERERGHATTSDPARTAGSRPRAVRALASRIRDGASTPQRLEPRVGEDLARRPVERDAAVVDHEDPAAQAVEQVGLVFDDEQRRPGRGQLAQCRGDQPGALRVELCGRLVEDEMGRSHGQQRGDHHQLRLTAGQPPRFALGEGLDVEDRERGLGPCHRLARRQPQVHRPERDLLEDRAGHPGELRGRVLEPDPDPRRELVERLAGHRDAIDRDRAGQPAADRAGRKPGGDQAQASTCPRRSPRRPRRSRRRRGSGRCRGGRSWRSRRSGTRPSRTSASATSDPRRGRRRARGRPGRAASGPRAPTSCRASPTGGGASPAG